MTEPQVLYHGAGPARKIQAEIVERALPPMERALGVASDFIRAASMAADDPALQRSMVILALEQVAKWFPAQVREAGK